VRLTPDGVLSVTNDGPVIPQETLSRLTARFERAGSTNDGSGLGLAIVAVIAKRIGSPLSLTSPPPGSASGLEVRIQLPVNSAWAK
jgi:two-component system OmpR family sensor kinase